jgi:signal transduction histidine kinase/CheY-like chemotaxis protein
VALYPSGIDIPVLELGIGSTPQASAVANRLRDEIDAMLSDGTAQPILKRWAFFSHAEMEIIHNAAVAHRQKTTSMGLALLLAIALLMVSVLYVRMRSANRKANAANEAKTQFLANMSHEIRTPLNGILGLAEVLSKSSLPQQDQDLVRTIRSSGKNLLCIVNDVLDLAAVARGRIELKPEAICVKSFVEEACLPFVISAREKKIGWKLEGLETLPEQILADAGRLRQVLVNLVGNAIKFTDVGSVSVRFAQVEAEGLKPGEPMFSIAITDSGIGISAEAQERLFEKFYQADASISRRFGGTGLGLSITKEIVNAMGGSIAVESEPGKSSCFWVQLPLLAVQRAVTAPSESPEPTALALQGKILLVEDNEVNRIVACSLLEMCGHTVTVACDGVQGVEIWSQGEFDLILMDCQMPRMDGYQAARVIREREGGRRRIPILALTASAMANEREECRAAGMDDFLSKPIQPKELQRLVQRALAQNRILA